MADDIATSFTHRETLDLTQRQTLLASHPFFSRLPTTDLIELARVMYEIHCTPGDIIVKEGDLVDAVYIIAEGTAEVTHKESTKYGTKTLFIATLTQGETIGLSEKGFFAPEGARTADVTSATKMVLLRLKVTDLSKFLRAHPQFTADTQHAAEILLRMNFIKQVAPFAHLTIGRIRWLSQHIEKINIPTNTLIFEQGSVGETCYLLFSGEVEIYINQPDGSQTTLAVLQPPALFGEAALLTHSPRNASAKTLSNAILFTITRNDLLALTGRELETNQAIMTLMTERARPLKVDAVQESQKHTADGHLIVTLKHPYRNEYFRLTEATHYLWQLIDGKHTIHNIISDVTARYPATNPELIYTTLFNLGNSGFIDLSSMRLTKHVDIWSLWTNANPLSWAIIIFSLLLLTSAGGYLWFNFNPSTHAPNGFIVSAPLVKFVMVVDLTDEPTPTQDDVLSGQLPILTIHTGSSSTNHANDVFDIVEQLTQLLALDTNNDGRIDSTDSTYSSLELVFMSPDGAIAKHIPISQAGIRAIILNRPVISTVAAKNEPAQYLNNVVSEIVMSDGSTHPIRIMPIDQRYLPQ
jgi:CRP/FNR family cyclic AMP-dependent transcriptional regulator